MLMAMLPVVGTRVLVNAAGDWAPSVIATLTGAAGATSQRKPEMAAGACSETLQLAPAGMSVTVVVCVPAALNASGGTA
ncbi:hypothetical protein D3C72_1386310 [compost metagenome]